MVCHEYATPLPSNPGFAERALLVREEDTGGCDMGSSNGDHEESRHRGICIDHSKAL